MRKLVLLPILAVVALICGASIVIADPGPKPNFYRMFPDHTGFTEPTQQQIADLAQTMLDPNAADGDNVNSTSGFTYFGQFLDHDLTLDTSPVPTAPEDPTEDANGRTFAFDLDSMYGPDDFTAHPEVYDAAGRFLLQEPNANGVRDYVRRADGSAVIFEGRNDENEIISQIQVAMMKAHNRLIDAGLSFENARQTLISAYQEAIQNDFLPHIALPVDDKTLNALDPKKTGTPLEFSVAAYRFGHSMVRKAYVLNETTGKIQVFTLTGPDLRGGRDIPAGRQINWGEFFSDIPLSDTDGNPINFPRRIDTLISSGLFVLPIPGAEATGSNVLAFRNMSRGVFYDIPSGQTVAEALGQTVYPPSTVANMPGFSTGTPLWYYIIWESMHVTNGEKLGPVGSAVVTAGFDAALKNGDKLVKGKTDPTQLTELRGPDGTMTVSDLFVFAGVASR
jgi:hypothetical protein